MSNAIPQIFQQLSSALEERGWPPVPTVLRELPPTPETPCAATEKCDVPALPRHLRKGSAQSAEHSLPKMDSTTHSVADGMADVAKPRASIGTFRRPSGTGLLPTYRRRMLPPGHATFAGRCSATGRQAMSTPIMEGDIGNESHWGFVPPLRRWRWRQPYPDPLETGTLASSSPTARQPRRSFEFHPRIGWIDDPVTEFRDTVQHDGSSDALRQQHLDMGADRSRYLFGSRLSVGASPAVGQVRRAAPASTSRASPPARQLHGSWEAREQKTPLGSAWAPMELPSDYRLGSLQNLLDGVVEQESSASQSERYAMGWSERFGGQSAEHAASHAGGDQGFHAGGDHAFRAGGDQAFRAGGDQAFHAGGDQGFHAGGFAWAHVNSFDSLKDALHVTRHMSRVNSFDSLMDASYHDHASNPMQTDSEDFVRNGLQSNFVDACGMCAIPPTNPNSSSNSCSAAHFFTLLSSFQGLLASLQFFHKYAPTFLCRGVVANAPFHCLYIWLREGLQRSDRVKLHTSSVLPCQNWYDGMSAPLTSPRNVHGAHGPFCTIVVEILWVLLLCVIGGLR